MQDAPAGPCLAPALAARCWVPTTTTTTTSTDNNNALTASMQRIISGVAVEPTDPVEAVRALPSCARARCGMCHALIEPITVQRRRGPRAIAVCMECDADDGDRCSMLRADGSDAWGQVLRPGCSEQEGIGGRSAAASLRSRWVCISDTHNQHGKMQDLPAGDVLIHAGDFTMTGTLVEVEEFLKWFAAQPFQHKILIAGNHEPTAHEAYYAEHWPKFHPGQSSDAGSSLPIRVISPEGGRQDDAKIRRLLRSTPGVTYLEDSGTSVLGSRYSGPPGLRTSSLATPHGALELTAALKRRKSGSRSPPRPTF
jgi:hypothetical protein